MNPNQQAAQQVVSIDNVSYLVKDLTPEVIELMNLMEATRTKLQEAQVNAAIHSAAYNQFGAALQEQMKSIKPINAGMQSAEAQPAPKKTPRTRK